MVKTLFGQVKQYKKVSMLTPLFTALEVFMEVLVPKEKGLSNVIPYFYIFLVAGMLISKFSTQKMIDAGKHKILVVISLVVLFITMGSYFFMATAVHLLAAGFLLGIGYGILQPLFQSFVTGTTPGPKRGTANATYLLSYDIAVSYTHLRAHET